MDQRGTVMTALTAMDKLLFWLGLGAAQKGARSKEIKPSRHWVVSLVVGCGVDSCWSFYFIGQPTIISALIYDPTNSTGDNQKWIS
jgi:hypothetical protein